MDDSHKPATRIFVIGASARAAANALAGHGYLPISADLFADRDFAEIGPVTRLGPNSEGAEDALKAANAEAWLYTGGLENRPELVDRLAAICPLWGNAGDVLRRVRDPRFLPETLAAAGLRHLPIAMGATGVPTDGSWLRKPIASAGGGRISRYVGRDPHDKETSGRWCYQPFLEGESLSGVFVAAGGECELLGVSRQLIGEKWTGARDFWYCGSIGPISLSYQAWKTWRTIGEALTRRGGMVGVFGVDAIVRGDEVWPVEINPRYPASAEIIDVVHRQGIMQFHMAACAPPQLSRQLIRQPLPRIPHIEEVRLCWGKAILFSERDGTMPSGLPHLSERSEHPSGQLPILADLPAVKTELHAGEPVLTLFAAGDNDAQVEARLMKRCAEVKKWLETHGKE